MLKAAGLVLIIAVSTAFGLRGAASLRQRKKRLSEFLLLLGEISDKIRVGTPLCEIAKGGRAGSLCDIEEYRLKPKTEWLKSADRELLEELFLSLGMSDTEAELSRLAAYRRLLSERYSEAAEAAAEKTRLYGLLGLFAGIFLSILLI